MGAKEKLTENVRVNLSPSERARVEARALLENRSISTLIRLATLAYLKRPA